MDATLVLTSVVIGLLAVIAILLSMAVRLLRQSAADHRSPAYKLLAAEIRQASVDAAANIGAATAHHAEVNAVLALTQTFRDQPDLIQNLAGYNRQVVAAALLHRVNCLGNDLRVVNERLSAVRTNLAGTSVQSNIDGYTKTVNRLQTLAADLRAELDEATQIQQQFNGPKALR